MGRMRSMIPKPARIITIPVVVHVVFNTTEQNVSEAQINSQLVVLNDNYRKRNSDISLVPPPFQPLAADMNVEFRLACGDPQGNKTQRI
jgi:hypothetical protein